MSAFWATCPACGTRYFHMFVGSALLSGHVCPAPEHVRFAARNRELRESVQRQADAINDTRPRP